MNRQKFHINVCTINCNNRLYLVYNFVRKRIGVQYVIITPSLPHASVNLQVYFQGRLQKQIKNTFRYNKKYYRISRISIPYQSIPIPTEKMHIFIETLRPVLTYLHTYVYVLSKLQISSHFNPQNKQSSARIALKYEMFVWVQLTPNLLSMFICM